jgi:hypothetical protein
MRSLSTDGRSRRAIWFLLLPVVVLGAWTVWFFEARVARYEESDQARVDGTAVIAGFAPVAAREIHVGQSARLRLQSGSVPARVTHVDSAGIVELHADSLTQNELPGSVEVQVASVSPAALLLRAVGQRRVR